MGRQAALSRAHRSARLIRGALWAITVINALGITALALALAVPLPSRAVHASRVVEYRDGAPAHIFLARDEKWRLPIALSDVDPGFVRALVALEDKRFFDHDGVDPIAIVRAAVSNLRHARRVSGGSTLTMQLARLLEPRPRTLRSKAIEMFRALQLDLRLTKREILEAYLTRAPYGGNVEGIETAAWSYFGHSARHLTPLEIATLLAVPQGPARFAPRAGNLDRLRRRRDEILGKLLAAGVWSGADAADAAADALATAPPERLRRLPRQAPHAAIALAKRYPLAPRIRSTLDAGVQALAERAAQLRRNDLARMGIHGGAIVVVAHATREVVALVGNLDFGDTAHGGQIAMFDRPRSPGSTLKPFVYALAIDRGLALPGFLVADVPSQYGTYRPRNFDGDWAGLVTLHDALARSLNLPFVDLLERVGVETFLGELGRMGLEGALARTAPGHYGLSLIAGGMALTPLELAGMYATLAEDGMYQPLRLLMDASDGPRPTQVMFGPGAAQLTREPLALRNRPDLPRRRALPDAAIHWKTGTSFGLRDAWAAGSGPAYTAVVWTGNVDNTPSAELVGSEAAGPLLFDVLEGLARRTSSDHAPPDARAAADLTTIEVCAYSGHLPGEACGERITTRAPLHAVPTQRCPYHQAYDVDRATGRAVVPSCKKPGRVYDHKRFIVLPSAITAWLTERRRELPPSPVFDDDCSADPGAPPVIVTPGEQQVVTLIPGVAADKQRVPLSASSRAGTLTWFIDGALLAAAPADQRVMWTPSEGSHEVVVADAAGRKARRVVRVERGASQRRP